MSEVGWYHDEDRPYRNSAARQAPLKRWGLGFFPHI